MHGGERDWWAFDAAGLLDDAERLSAALSAACARRRSARFILVGATVDGDSADTLAAALARVDASLRLRAEVRPPLARRQLRELRRVGLVALHLPGVTPWSVAFAHLELLVACADEGVALRHDLADVPEPVVPTLVHLPPPGEAPAGAPLARWRAAHASGLLVRRRTPDGLRVVDSRRMAWSGRASGARPRVVHLRGDVAAVLDACRRPRSLAGIRDDLPALDAGAVARAVAALTVGELLVEIGEQHLALAVDEPAWYERDPLDAREPLRDLLPAASGVWDELLRDVPWARPARRAPARLPVLDPEGDA